MNVIKYKFKHNMKLFKICEVFIFNRKKVGFMDGSMFKLQHNTGEILLDLVRVTSFTTLNGLSSYGSNTV